MGSLFSWKNFAFLLLLAGVVLTLWGLIFGGYLHAFWGVPDFEKAKEIHPFMTGLVVPLLTLGSTLLVIENLRANNIQNFSNNFFKLIDQHHKLIDNINSWIEPISSPDNPCKGRAFFDELAERIANDYYFISNPDYANEYEIDPDLETLIKEKSGKELLVIIYNFYFHIHFSDLAHYFRNLYHIICFVERSTINTKRKKEYVHMLRAQLSNYEILLLGYNGLHPYGAKFHPLIEKYWLLKSLNTEDNLPPGRIKRIVDISILRDGYTHFEELCDR